MRFLASLGMTGNTVIPNGVRNLRMTAFSVIPNGVIPVIPNGVRNLRMTGFAWFHRRHGGDGSFTLN